MKKMLIFLLFIMTPFMVFAYPKGDVNGDNTVDNMDVALVRNHIRGTSKLTGDRLTRADVSGDNKVDNMDVVLIRNIIRGQGSTSTPTPTPKPTSTPTPKLTAEKIHFIKQSSDDSLDESLSAGDCILLESNGHYAMIDTGLNNETDNKYILNYLKKVGVTKLDFVLITHHHRDHIGGLYYLMQNIKISRLYFKTYPGSNAIITEINKNIKSLASSKGIKITYIEKSFNDGDSITFEDMDIKLYNTKTNTNVTLHYTKSGKVTYNKVNENSNTVLEFIKVNGFKVLLTGDLYDEADNIKLINSMSKKSTFKNLDVLKMPHHGYTRSAFGSSTNGTYNKTAYTNFNPKYTVITNISCKICKYIGATSNLYYSRKNTAVVFSFNGSIKVNYVS